MNSLRWGYTTGACAAAAALAAARVTEGEPPPSAVELPLSDGLHAIPIAWAKRIERGTEAAVVKDAGDDPDVTHGAHVVVRLRRASDWTFHAGEGVGTVTLPGLPIPVGEPAINPGPRTLIRSLLEARGWSGARIEIAIPGGEVLAQRTFNPRLGIQGGLSILGTQGRVRPFSTEAVEATVRRCLDVAKAQGRDRVALVPGHLGARALRNTVPLPEDAIVEVSNAWGVALEHAVKQGFRNLLLAGHPGKLAKLAFGAFDTHSQRSPSAHPFVEALLKDLGLPIASTPTVEGLFQALPDEARRRAATVLGERIARSVQAPFGCRCAVLLTSLEATVYGGWKEESPWP